MCMGGLIELKVVWFRPGRIYSGANHVGGAEGSEVSG